jgi:hypothetical protein
MTFGIIILPNILTNLLRDKPLRKPFFKFTWWLGLAAFLQFTISVIYSYNYSQKMNFVMHAVGGGVACALMFQHIKAQMKWKFTRFQELMFLLAFVSVFGVINELAEFSLDTLGFGRFSIDRIDTWLDLLANSSGALIGHLFILGFYKPKINLGKTSSSR